MSKFAQNYSDSNSNEFEIPSNLPQSHVILEDHFKLESLYIKIEILEVISKK